MHVGLEITLISPMTHPRANFTKHTKVNKPTRMTFCNFQESSTSFKKVTLPTCVLATIHKVNENLRPSTLRLNVRFNIHSSQPMPEVISFLTRRFAITLLHSKTCLKRPLKKTKNKELNRKW